MIVDIFYFPSVVSPLSSKNMLTKFLLKRKVGLLVLFPQKIHKKYKNFENQTFLEKKLEKISFIYCKMLIKLGSEIMSLEVTRGFNRISLKLCLNHKL